MGHILANCAVPTHKIVTISKRPQWIDTGKKKCDFRWYQDLGIKVEFDSFVEINYDRNLVFSKEEVALLSVLESGDIYNRNLLVYRYNNYLSTKPYQGRRWFLRKYVETLKKWDKEILDSVEGKLKLLDKFPRGHLVSDVIWLVTNFYDPNFVFDLTTRDGIYFFMYRIGQIVIKIKENGFPYIKPSSTRLVDNLKEETKVETKVKERERRDSYLYKKLSTPHEKMVSSGGGCVGDIEFSDSESSDQEDDDNENENDQDNDNCYDLNEFSDDEDNNDDEDDENEESDFSE